MKKKWSKFLCLTAMILISTSAFPNLKQKYPSVYPFTPFETIDIETSIERFTEDPDYLINFQTIINQNLSQAKTKIKPWTSTYWPLNKGLIADPYEKTFIGYYFERGFVSWTKNFNIYKARKRGILNHIDNYSEHQLATLAPSEKYDLLLGDKEFNLTAKLWDYMKSWGSKKQYGFKHDIFLIGNEFPSLQNPEQKLDALELATQMVNDKNFDSIEIAFRDSYKLQTSLAVKKSLNLIANGQFESVIKAWPTALKFGQAEATNYVLEKKNSLMAFWEGICHGWATAAGIVPRPRKTLSFELPDGRNLKFFPTDIKALASLLWANSLIQDLKITDPITKENTGGGVISEGLRCNLEKAKLDKWGRRYDHTSDPINGDHSTRCAGVHPAIWYLTLVNIIGKQGRSFVIDRKVGHEVDNHPLYSYSMKYYNPNNGRNKSSIMRNIVPINRRDQFRKFRNKAAKFIIGVEAKVRYLDWTRPKRYFFDSESYDASVTKKMYFDLELDENYKIVGGQWRAIKFGRPESNFDDGLAELNAKLNHNQPDFLWVITKDWKPFFEDAEDITEAWTDTSKAPPKSWLTSAREAHDFIYFEKYNFGTGQKCKHIHKVTGKSINVSCEFEVPKPQPLVNIVNKLIEMAK